MAGMAGEHWTATWLRNVADEQSVPTIEKLGLIGESWAATPEKGQRLLDAIARDVADALSNPVLWEAPI